MLSFGKLWLTACDFYELLQGNRSPHYINYHTANFSKVAADAFRERSVERGALRRITSRLHTCHLLTSQQRKRHTQKPNKERSI